MADDQRDARRGLACAVEAGDSRLPTVLEEVGPVDAWRGLVATTMESPWGARAKRVDLEALRAAEAACGARFVIPSDDEWPQRLQSLRGCKEVQGMTGEPVGLWVRGQAPLAEVVERSVAIVGSRAATALGERVASDLAAELASAGVTVVSGGAYGVDAAAHRGALAVAGTTVAFLAGGPAHEYPRGHASLLQQIAATGLVVSEQPPGEVPSRLRFLSRNRLIAASSLGTVVVEAAARSGARNTSTWARECGRPVMAVPGPVTSATSFTPHQLIREADAVLVTCAEHVLTEVGPLRPERESEGGAQGQPRLLDMLVPADAAVYEALPSRGARPVGELALRAGVAVPACLGALQRLADMGLAEPATGGRWRLGRAQDRPLLPREAAAGVPRRGVPRQGREHGA